MISAEPQIKKYYSLPHLNLKYLCDQPRLVACFTSLIKVLHSQAIHDNEASIQIRQIVGYQGTLLPCCTANMFNC
jgi:hypothetical protein